MSGRRGYVLFINKLLGIGVGTRAIGALPGALQLKFGDESLRYSILAGTGFYVLAEAALEAGGRRLDHPASITGLGNRYFCTLPAAVRGKSATGTEYLGTL